MQQFELKRFRISQDLEIIGDVGGPADAPAVILLHGGGQTRHSWLGAMRALVDAGYHVINYDARGHGDSGWAKDGDYTVQALAGDLRTIAGSVTGPLALVGASMGGITSFFAVGTYDPPIARALVMVDVAITPAREGAARVRSFMAANPEGFATVEEAADAVAGYNPDRPRSTNAKGLLRNLRQREGGRYHWHWDPQLVQVDPDAEQPEFWSALPEVSAHVKIPTLLIRGSHSDVVTNDVVAEMVRLVPQTEVANVQDAGHMVAGDKNDAFNKSMLDFLKKNHPISEE